MSATDNLQESIRAGFGRGLLKAAQEDKNVVVLTADLAESTNVGDFRDEFPERFIDVGVAEQNLVTVGSGMAKMGKVPFVSSYAAICLNDMNVKIIGAHAGLGTSPDGATHQALEDIALMRVLPNMQVFAPADSVEAEKITLAVAKTKSPSYIRLTRPDVPVFTNPNHEFKIGEGARIKAGQDVTILSTGTATWHALEAGIKLKDHGIDAEVLHFPTIKPLDEDLILESAKRTGLFVTVEDHQVAGGFGSAVSEFLSENLPIPLVRVGVENKFGQSGTPDELLRLYGITSTNIVKKAVELIKKHTTK